MPTETNWPALIVLGSFGLIVLLVWLLDVTGVVGRGGLGSDGVHVRGYHRSDGTYVAPHTRSRPHH